MPETGNREKRSFEEHIAALPAKTQQPLKEGLSLVSRLDSVQMKALVDVTITLIDEPHAIEKMKFPEILGLSENDSLDLVVLGTALSVSGSMRETTSEMADILQKRFSLSKPETSAVSKLIEAFRAQQGEVDHARERRQLGDLVLPSFENIWWTVDMRLKLSGGELSTFVPVAIAHLKTDAPNSGRFWFQLSRSQLKRLVDELQQALRDMEEAEKWVKQHNQSTDLK
jgi:hypothetical protein